MHYDGIWLYLSNPQCLAGLGRCSLVVLWPNEWLSIARKEDTGVAFLFSRTSILLSLVIFQWYFINSSDHIQILHENWRWKLRYRKGSSRHKMPDGHRMAQLDIFDERPCCNPWANSCPLHNYQAQMTCRKWAEDDFSHGFNSHLCMWVTDQSFLTHEVNIFDWFMH